MYQVAKHICRCGDIATVRHKITGEWFCRECAYLKMALEYGRAHGLTNIMIAPLDKGMDFFALLVEVYPIKLYWN